MARYKLLIAEDSKMSHLLYKRSLGDKFELTIAPDGEQALAAYRALKPEIILLDMHMPLLNGFQLLKAIRQEHNDSTTTIIMATSAAEKASVVACARLGIQGYIVKPFKAEELVMLILKYHEGRARPAE